MRNILIQGAQKFNITLTDSDIESFCLYFEFLENKNRVMNLTAITGEKDMAELHFLDSLALLTIDGFGGKSVIDIGSGAGFPGIPMKIIEKSMKLTLLDAQQKKVAFLSELLGVLKMSNVTCLNARAEDLALQAGFRDNFDFAVSRAVAKLNVLSEICLPFVKVHGAFIAMKSIDSDEEIQGARKAIKILGAEIEKVTDYVIPGTSVTHRAVVVRKKTGTPDGYPRRFAKIQKNPL